MGELYDTSLVNDFFGPVVNLFNSKQGDTLFQVKSLSNQKSELRGDTAPLQGIPEFGAKSPGIIVFPLLDNDEHFFQNTTTLSL